MQVKYLRNKNGHPYATFWTDGDKFGWSLCHKDDKFVKKVGVAHAKIKAVNPAQYWMGYNEPPSSIRKKFFDWMDDKLRYCNKNDNYEMFFKGYYSDQPQFFLTKGGIIIAEFNDQKSITEVFEQLVGKGPFKWELNL